MNIFKTDPAGFAAVRKQTLVRTLPVMLFGVIVVFAANFSPSDFSFDMYPMLIAVPVMLAAVARGIYIGLKKRRKLYDSFTVEITEDTVTRTQADTADLSLNRLEISSISKDPTGIITIRGMEQHDVIQIPATMERSEELQAILSRIMPFTESNERSLLERFGWITGIITILLMVTVRFANNKIVVVLSAAGLIALLVWSFLRAYRNKNVPDRYKRSSWIILLLIGAVIAAVLMKLGWVPDLWEMNAE